MTKWNTAVGDTFISNTFLKLLTVSISIPLFRLRSPLYWSRNREIAYAHLLHFPPRTHQYPTSLVRNFQPTLPCGLRTSYSHANVEIWKVEHIKPYLTICRTSRQTRKTLTSCYSSVREPWRIKMAHGIRREPDELEKEHCSSLFSTLFDSTVPCDQYLSLRRFFWTWLCVTVLKLFRCLNQERLWNLKESDSTNKALHSPSTRLSHISCLQHSHDILFTRSNP